MQQETLVLIVRLCSIKAEKERNLVKVQLDRPSVK